MNWKFYTTGLFLVFALTINPLLQAQDSSH